MAQEERIEIIKGVNGPSPRDIAAGHNGEKPTTSAVIPAKPTSSPSPPPKKS